MSFAVYKIGNFKLDKKNARLFQCDVEITVEPKLYQLLLLFIDNPETIISRDMIIDSLWDGRYVTDNAINKQVANLRKLLNDNPKQPEYIQTVPKLGYRLICSIETLTPEPLHSRNAPITTNPISRIWWLAASILIIVILKTFWPSHSPTQLINTKTQELTRQTGIEHSPRQIIGTDSIVFLRQQLGQSDTQLWLKDLIENDQTKIELNGHVISRIITAQKEQDALTRIMFLEGKGPDCNVFQSSINIDNQLSDSIRLFNCNGQRISDIALSPNKKTLFYTASSRNSPESQLYSYDIDLQLHELLRQPEPVGRGNHALDISPDGEKLLLMSTDEQRKTTLHTLNLTSNKLSRHKTFNYYVDEAIWDHNSQGIYYFAAPPSHQIIHSDLDGEDTNTVVSASDYLARNLSRLNKQDLLFSTRRNNFNNLWLNQGNALLTDNSSVYDIIPSLFHQDHNYLFISKRSGKSELYITDLNTSNTTLLSNFDGYHSFRYLELSPDDNQLLLSDHNCVWNILVPTLLSSPSKINLSDMTESFCSPATITGLGWLNHNTFYVATADKAQPMKIFTVTNDGIKLTRIDDIENWHYLISDHYTQQLFLVDKVSRKISTVANFKQWQAEESATETGLILPKGAFHPKVSGGKLYYVTRDNKGFKLNWQALKEPYSKGELALAGYYLYDSAKSGTIVSQLVSIEGDIHKTLR